MVSDLSRPLSSDAAWWFASAGLVLAVVAYYEHARRKETPQAVGFGLASLGLFLWAGLRGPLYFVFVIAAIAVLVPWLIWGRKPQAVRSSLLARSPFVIQRRERPILVPVGTRGVLDFKRDGVRAMNTITEVLTKMTKEMNRQQRWMPKHTRRLERALQRGASVEREYRLTEKAARDIEAHANDMDRLERRLREAREAMITNFTDWLRSQSNTPDAGEVRMMIRELGKAAGEGRKGAGSYQKVVADLRRRNISVPVSRAADRLDGALSRIVEDIRAIERFGQTQGRGRSARRGAR